MPDLPRAVDAEVGGADPGDLRLQLVVDERSSRWWPRRRRVVGTGRSAARRRSARPRSVPCLLRCRRSSRRSAVELRRDEGRCGLEDLVGPAELEVLALQDLQALPLIGREARTSPSSVSAWRTQRRNVSCVMPSLSAIEQIAAQTHAGAPVDRAGGIDRPGVHDGSAAGWSSRLGPTAADNRRR